MHLLTATPKPLYAIEMRFLIILIVGFLSCNQPEATQKTNQSDSTVITNVADVKQQVETKSKSVNYDSSIYARFIPKQVFNLLKQKLPDWKFMNPNEWESFWFEQYQKDSSLVNYVPADFNCDGKNDYAFLLKNSKGVMAVWVLQSYEGGYNTFKVHEIETDRKPIDVGIDLVEKGKLEYIDLDDESIKSINIKCPAVQVLFFERGAVTYYWSKDKFESVQTGD